MEFDFKPKGVCSRLMKIDVEDGKLKSLKVIGGCDGNLKGIASLCVGMDTEEIISRLEGICCGRKKTSCPDQLAQALKLCRGNN